MWELIITSLIALAVVILSGIFALKQIRENALLNEKIKWIEDLRELISEYLSQVNILTTVFNDLNATLIEISEKGKVAKIDIKKSAELMEPVQKESKLLNKVKHKIILYLSNDSEQIKMEKIILELYEAANIEIKELSTINFEQVHNTLDSKATDLIDECRTQFKKEREKIIPFWSF